MQLLNIIQCQLCGNRTKSKRGISFSEMHLFQLALDKDHIPITLKHHLFFCKPCYTYLQWQTNKTDDFLESIKNQDLLKRYLFNKKYYSRNL